MHFNPDVEQAISTSRLSTYRSQSATDGHAWHLYRWNVELGAALGPLTADLEVTLRNTVHDRLSIYFGRSDWWASPSLLLDDITADMLTKVVAKHQKKIAKGTVGPGKVIADTTLGIWVHLLGRGGQSALGRVIDYETNLWRPALRHGFFTGTVELRREGVQFRVHAKVFQDQGLCRPPDRGHPRAQRGGYRAYPLELII